MRAFKFAVKYDTVADLNMSPTALYLLTEKEDDFPPAVIHGLFRQATKGRVGKDDVWENYRSYWNGKKIEDWEEAQCRAQSKPTEPTAVERAETHRRWVEEEARREAEAGAEPEPQPEPKHEPEVISKNAMLALSSTLRIFARVLDAGPEDCRFRNNARGLFDAGCHASEGAERNPSFLRQ